MAGARRKWRVLTGLLALAAGAWGSAAQAGDSGARRPRAPAHFELVGHHPLPNPGGTVARGLNGPTAIAGSCLYVGSRIGRRPGTGPAFGTAPLPAEVLIVDISRPRRPRPVGALRLAPGAATRELLTIPDARTLILASQHELQVQDITDCRRPVLRQTIRLGADQPGGLFLWRDPREPARFLLYAAVMPGDARAPSLRVFELMAPPDGPISPEPVAALTLASTESRGPPAFAWLDEAFVFGTQQRDARRPHVTSVSVSPDGTRVYAADSQGGQHVLDGSRLANREPCTRGTVDGETYGTGSGLCLRALNPSSNPRGTSARTDVRAPDARQGFPTGSPPVSRPYLVSTPPLVFPHLFFEARGPAGLRLFDISNPMQPMEVGAYVPRPAARVAERAPPGTGAASSPLLYNGLLYLTGESGLDVLRYKGPRASELPRTGLHASNAHLRRPSRAVQARVAATEGAREESTRR